MAIQSPRPFPTTAREASLDDTIESSFPASDPPSTIPDPDLPERSLELDWSTGTTHLRPGPIILFAAVGAAAAMAVWAVLRMRRV
jgi:hypothetical protein